MTTKPILGYKKLKTPANSWQKVCKIAKNFVSLHRKTIKIITVKQWQINMIQAR